MPHSVDKKQVFWFIITLDKFTISYVILFSNNKKTQNKVLDDKKNITRRRFQKRSNIFKVSFKM